MAKMNRSYILSKENDEKIKIMSESNASELPGDEEMYSPAAPDEIDRFNREYRVNPNVKQKPELRQQNILLSVRHLKQFFTFGRGIHKMKNKAVNDISFDIHEGECLGIVGESGCGKTTTGRSIIRLYNITSGSIYYRGVRISGGTRWNQKEIKYYTLRTKKKIEELKQSGSATEEQIRQLEDSIRTVCDEQKAKIRQVKFDNTHVSRRLMNEIQMIFQDPVDSLDPRMTVEDIIQEGLRIQGFRTACFGVSRITGGAVNGTGNAVNFSYGRNVIAYPLHK